MRTDCTFQRTDMHMLAMMTFVERLTFRFGREQWRHGRRVRRQILQILEILENILAGTCLEMNAVFQLVGLARQQCRTEGHIQVSVGRHDEFVDLAFKGAVEGFA